MTGPERAMLETVADDVAELERVVEGVGFERAHEVTDGETDQTPDGDDVSTQRPKKSVWNKAKVAINAFGKQIAGVDGDGAFAVRDGVEAAEFLKEEVVHFCRLVSVCVGCVSVVPSDDDDSV